MSFPHHKSIALARLLFALLPFALFVLSLFSLFTFPILSALLALLLFVRLPIRARLFFARLWPLALFPQHRPVFISHLSIKPQIEPALLRPAHALCQIARI